MGRRDEYRMQLRACPAQRWPAFLRKRSGLPGPRANIELAEAVADEGHQADFDRLIATDEEYLVFCGVIGLGSVLVDHDVGDRLRRHAADPRWRVREAVAMALQRLGDADMRRLFTLAAEWAGDADPLVARAAVAGVCEPRLLRTADAAARAVDICAGVTARLAARPETERADPGNRALRQALGYCWSVAVAADPADGLARFRALADYDDRDVAWIVRQNSRKARLARLL